MWGLLGTNRPRASENFYRNLFALLAAAVFAYALYSNSPTAFLATLLFGSLSRTAAKKGWKNPKFAERTSWLISKPRREEDNEEDRED